jgi:DNA-binding NarL/FixJ family response regulator
VKVLQTESRFTIAGEATNGEELVALATEFAPDLLIVDINMPVLNGIEAVKQINHLGINCKIIALSMHNEDSILAKMLDAGAMSILDKNTSRDELYEAIETVVVQNRLYFPAATNAKMLTLLKTAAFKGNATNAITFSERELEVINLVCRDFSNKMIADKLDISPRTVESHRMRIMEKMSVKSVAGLVAFAFSHELLFDIN